MIGGAGMEHRSVFVRDRGGAGLVDEFEALGWNVERDVAMVRRRPPDRGPEIEVEEVGEAQIEGLRRELIRDGLPVVGSQTRADRRPAARVGPEARPGRR